MQPGHAVTDCCGVLAAAVSSVVLSISSCAKVNKMQIYREEHCDDNITIGCQEHVRQADA